MQNLNPVFQQALAPFAPPEKVTAQHVNRGSGGDWLFVSTDREAAQKEAMLTKSELGIYRSASSWFEEFCHETGEWHVTLRYYGLD